MEDSTVGVLPMLVALDAALNHSVATAVDWWAGVTEEDALRSLPLDGEGGLWASSFVPPPPRPAYLEENVSNDGLTTCDLCTWAWRDDALTFVIDAAQDTEELGWVFTLAVVSILSAVIGAVIMITLLQCRNRIKSIGSTCSLCVARPPPPEQGHGQGQGHKEVTLALGGPPPGGGGAWKWFPGGRRATQLCAAAPTTPVENHYTLDGEALYAELDKDSSPAYQNTAYTEDDRTYEAVGEGDGPPRTTVPSDYV